MFLKVPFAFSFSDIFIAIHYAVFRKSLRTFYVSLHIYIYMKPHENTDHDLNMLDAINRTTCHHHMTDLL